MSAAHFTCDDGCRIAFEFLSDEDKPVLVLSPSLGTAMALFDPQLAALSPDYSILRYDPRGHGASDVPPGGYSLDRLGRDVVELLDHLGIARAHFLGVSLGGMTGQWLGYRVPKRIDRLILANTSAYMGPPSGWTERIATVQTQGMAGMTDTVLERWFTPGFRSAEAAKVAPIRALLAATDPAGYSGCSAAIRDMDLGPTAALITAPTLVISGLQDPATPPDHGAFLAQSIPGANLVELDAAHLSNVELASAFNAAVSAFLGG